MGSSADEWAALGRTRDVINRLRHERNVVLAALRLVIDAIDDEHYGPCPGEWDGRFERACQQARDVLKFFKDSPLT